MAGVRDNRRRLSVSEFGSGRRSAGVLGLLLVAVLAMIAFIWNLSRRPVHRPSAPIANAEPAAPPPAASAMPALAADPVPAPAAGPVPAPATSSAPMREEAVSDRKQAEIARVISDGRPGLKVCYQRALNRDATLTVGHLTVRLSIAASGKVDNVKIAGPAAFRALGPCLETAISKWTFPAGSEPYAAKFPLVFRGEQ